MSENLEPIVCIGEAIVDLICERNLAPGEGPGAFVPYPGGALANVAVAAARHGAPSALVGGVGEDRWGSWLIEELAAERVSTEWVTVVEGADTPLGIVLFDQVGEPGFQIYGEHIAPTMLASRRHLEPAIGRASAIVVGSNTMVGPVEREVTRQAIEIAHDSAVPVLFDPNFRPNRWVDHAEATAFCRELAGASAVVKCNRTEAALITGERDPLDAARALATFGPRLAVVTSGDGTVLTAGVAEAEHDPPAAEVVSPLGAGDAFMGALAAGLKSLDWDFTRVGEVLPDAARAGAGACRGWGAQ
jgi:sugar/nucleoside kinase (ribokinase family)